MWPTLWQWGPVTIHSYGALFAIAYVIGTLIAVRQARQAGVDPNRILDATLWMTILGLIGARLVYVAQHLEDYLAHPLEIVMLHHGGLVFYGGLAGGVIGFVVYVKRHRLNGWRVADLFAPAVAIGHAIGRIGCFLNGCCYGKILWGFQQPTQLYESASLMVIGGFLLSFAKKPHAQGVIFLTYLILYAIVRFFLEFLRGDDPVIIVGLTFSQWISVVICAVALSHRASR